jgi:transposase
MAADGVANSDIGERLGVSRSTVLGWRRDFAEHGVEWVGKVRPGRGPKPTISQEAIEAMAQDTLHPKRHDGSALLQFSRT